MGLEEDYKKRAEEHQGNDLKDRIWRVIFLSDTPGAKTFDLILMIAIGISVIIVMLESVESINMAHRELFLVVEWIFTILFTIEYLVRIWVVRKKSRYIFSFYGIIDLISILPTYLTILLSGTHYLMIVRVLRLLRVFRVLKMGRHMGEANHLMNALRSSWAKISVFIFCVIAVTMILGTAMFVVEGLIAKNEGFSNVPQSIYWAIVTISTVGYGDITPVTVMGKMLATVIILIGYGIIAVPTGIVTAELNARFARVQMDYRVCGECGLEGHDPKAIFCKSCGTKL
ncbi:MAG: ion transporter [Verrucomicrobiales bacterium]|nr:ion transporter [Verrucomicrobiales bacterium]